MPTCQWIAKNGRVEGSSADGNSEQMAVATVAAVLCILPGISMIISSMIRNERTIFTLLETGKYAIALDLILLVLGCLDDEPELFLERIVTMSSCLKSLTCGADVLMCFGNENVQDVLDF